MNDAKRPGIIPAAQVRRVTAPAWLESNAAAGGAMTVTPIMDGDRVAGLEVRCRCGERVVVECLYGEGDA